MDEATEADLLGVPAEDLDDVLEHFEERSFRGLDYRALPDERHGIERGTVLVGDTAVRGFPSIPRVLMLAEGIREQFDGELVVEEKLDGYNVRIARIPDAGAVAAGGAGAVVAFTRSGYVCPYTTRRVHDLLDVESYFADHPETMLCCEVIGPETPYSDHDYDDVESDAVRVFDVRDRITGGPLPVAERRERCASYGFDQPTLFGRFEPAEAAATVPGVIRHLDVEDREGVVMQSADGERLLKYTTGAHHRDGLAFAFSLPFDYGADFVLSRLIREAFQSVGFGEDEAAARERAHDVGEAILLPMIETIRRVEAGETVGEAHTVRGDPEAIDELLDHFRDVGVRLAIDDDREIEGERVVTFRKLSESTTDRTAYYLGGGTRDE